MKIVIQKKIAKYKFEDSLKTVYATPLGNFLLFVGFLMSDSRNFFTYPRALFSLAIAILFFVIIRFNNWGLHGINLLFIFVYAFSFIIEYVLFGIPTSLLGYGTGLSVSKGVLLEFIGGLTPFMYIGARLLLVIPLIQMTKTSYQLTSYY